MAKDPYKVDVGRRLRLTAAHLGLETATDLARTLGAERGQVDAWLNGRSLPPVQYMNRLCETYGLTLDWIYREKLAGLTYDRAILLKALMEGDLAPAEAPAGMASVAEEVAPPAASRRRSAKAKTAT